jgi:hypothetical protein
MFGPSLPYSIKSRTVNIRQKSNTVTIVLLIWQQVLLQAPDETTPKPHNYDKLQAHLQGQEYRQEDLDRAKLDCGFEARGVCGALMCENVHEEGNLHSTFIRCKDVGSVGATETARVCTDSSTAVS